MRYRLNAAIAVAGVIVMLAAFLSATTGCASGEVDDNSSSNGEDVENGGELDGGVADAPQNNGQSDTDASGEEPDTDADGGGGGGELCDGDQDCSDDDQVCDLYEEICVDACAAHSDCASDACRFSTGHCLECDDDAHCEDGVCDDEPEPPVCRDCMINLDCPGDLVCSPDFECVECVDDAVCPGPFTPFCNTEENSCVRCANDDQCPGDDICHPGGEDCVECLDDTDCPEQYECEDGRCAGCESDTDCPGGVCRQDDSVCVECYEDDQCTGSFRCDDEDFICHECLDNQDCETLGAVCAFEFDLDLQHIVRFCADCETNSDCVGDEPPLCNSDYQCVECIDDGDCGASQACSAGGSCI